MAIAFTQIPEKLNYPPRIRGEVSTIHSAIISKFSATYGGTFKERKHICNLMNSVTYSYMNGDTIHIDLNDPEFLNAIPSVDSFSCEELLGDLYLDERKLTWDIDIQNDAETVVSDSAPSVVRPVVASEPEHITLTPKCDLYIQPPVVPRFDTSRVWATGVVDQTRYSVYYSVPDIPSKQNEISATTDVTKMTGQDLRKLFPNHFIQTRASSMYQKYDDLDYDMKLGTIFPVSGFTRQQVIDNIIKYPHIFKLNKLIGSDIVSFYSTIEIGGVLHKVSDIWPELEESKVIPYTADFVKEYVVRRYLLERDVFGVKHNHPIYGAFDSFLTLFTTPDDYVSFGYTDIEGLARKCVEARVAFKRSRNPVLRRLENV